jgi:hypothetical protein
MGDWIRLHFYFNVVIAGYVLVSRIIAPSRRVCPSFPAECIAGTCTVRPISSHNPMKNMILFYRKDCLKYAHLIQLC